MTATCAANLESNHPPTPDDRHESDREESWLAHASAPRCLYGRGPLAVGPRRMRYEQGRRRGVEPDGRGGQRRRQRRTSPAVRRPQRHSGEPGDRHDNGAADRDQVACADHVPVLGTGLHHLCGQRVREPRCSPPSRVRKPGRRGVVRKPPACQRTMALPHVHGGRRPYGLHVRQLGRRPIDRRCDPRRHGQAATESAAPSWRRPATRRPRGA